MAELVGGSFLSAFLQVLFDRLGSREVLDFLCGKKSIADPLEELNTKLLSANALLNDAEEKQMRDLHVKKWLDMLQEAIYDADDLADKIDFEGLRSNLEADSTSKASKMLMKLIPSSFHAFDRSVSLELEELVRRLKLLIDQKDDIGLRNGVQHRPLQRLPAPLEEESSVFGRDGDKEAIVRLLLSDHVSSKKISVIPIVGMGGIGKSTLAQVVFNDNRVRQHFALKVWVTVSDDFDIFKITKIILESVTSQKCNTYDLYQLQAKLTSALMDKKFLFVHDDVWNENYGLWDVLRSPFESGAHGSTIIITTRSQIVASKMGNVPAYDLQAMSDEDSWNLFAKHAFNNAELDAHTHVQVIGRQIVKKCKGLPLAVKSVAGLLRSEPNSEEWKRVLMSDMWELHLQKDGCNDILPSLWLSYHFLPSHLKRCFAYCSIFPKDHELEKEKLILLWMAEGLIQSVKGKRIEDVGEEYFDALISRSFIQQSRSKSPFLLPSWDNYSTFVMHDLVHDLAMFVSSEFCFWLDDTDLHGLGRKTRHLSYRKGIRDVKKFEGLSKAECLRTFLALPLSTLSGILQPKYSVPYDVLLKIGGCLRVLSLSESSIAELPDSIGNLKHLRYLDLSFVPIREISSSVCTLYKLQTFLLICCKNLTRLPTNMARLINLRHLSLGSNVLKEMPPEMCNLRNLQTLTDFVVGKHRGASIKDLKELLHLRGRLDISGLENVVRAEDVLEANLKGKECLGALGLSWSGDTDDSQMEREVLDALQPHANLKELYIDSYRGTRFSDWIGHESFSNTVRVHLMYCKCCCILPPLGQLPHLKELSIWGFDSVVTVGDEFYSSAPLIKQPFSSLEILDFRYMPEWQEWSFIQFGEDGVFPSLRELLLDDCPKLRVHLPDYLPSLTIIEVSGCKELMPILPRAQQMGRAFPLLQTVHVLQCPEQVSFLEGGLPPSVKSLVISYCDNLKAFADESFQGLASLEKLEIDSCRELKCLPEGGLPVSLSYVRISCCPHLKPRCQREKGEDWPRIAHIPRIKIDGQLI